MQRVAAELEAESVPRHEFLRHTGFSERNIMRLFGSYNELVEAAGLQPNYFPSSDSPLYSDEDLISEIIRVLKLPESKMTRIYFEQNSNVSASVCERRFGGWINALRTVKTYLNPEADAALINRVREYTAPYISAAPTPKQITIEKAVPVTTPSSSDFSELHVGHPQIESGSTNLYGDFINFRGLQHAPVNEQGVVFLFGMICSELDYVVEIVRSGFPDCEAKRRVRGKSGIWQRVRIEFEFQSRNFRTHGHDPDLCDVIVCWEDNWPDCPIEVLELKPAISHLSSSIQ